MENGKNTGDSDRNKAKREFFSFKLRFLTYLLLPVLLLSGLMAILITGFAKNALLTSQKEDASRLFNICSEELRTCIFKRNFSEISPLLKKLLDMGKFHSLILRDNDGKEVLVLENKKHNISPSYITHTHKLITPGAGGNTEIWQLDLNCGSNFMTQLIDLFLLFQIVVIMVISLGASIGVFIVIDNLIIGPMKSIADASLELAKGRVPQEITYSYNDEIGHLIDSFNQLINSEAEKEKRVANCLKNYNCIRFKLDPVDNSLILFGDKIPGTEIDTIDINTPEALCNRLQAGDKTECKQFWYSLKQEIETKDSGIKTFDLKIVDEFGEIKKQEQHQWLRLNLCWEKNQKGIFCQGIIHNITAENEHYLRISESEEKFRKIYENCPIGIWRSRGENFIYMNQAMAMILGYANPGEAITKIRSITHEIYLKPEDRTFFYDEMKKKGEVKNLELRFKKADGKIIWASLFGRLHRDSEGLYAEGGFIDVTEKHLAEEALRCREEDYRLSLDAASVVTYTVNLTDGKISFNGPSQEVLGIEPQKILPIKEFQKMIHPDDLNNFPPAYDKSIKKETSGNSSHYVMDLRICGSSSSGELEVRHFRMLFNFFNFSAHDRPCQVRGIMVDLTSQIAYEQSLEKTKATALTSSQLKTEFFADMSHEIRTPLNAIIGFSELLAPTVNNITQISYINSILSSGRSLLKIVNDILDLAKLESGKIEILYEPVSIEVLAREIKSVFLSDAEAKGLEFDVLVDDSVPSLLLLDELRLKQILNNLINNAIKFTDSGKVLVSFSAAPAAENGKSDLIVSVEDTGIGISQADKERIFEPFLQKRGQGAKFGGTGLGLAICKKLVEVMQGDICLKSEAGIGSKFEFRLRNLQIETLSRQLQPESGSKAGLFRFDSQKVLVVDDAVSNRELLHEALTTVGLTVLTASNGEEAVAMALNSEPDLIIMDIRMPRKDGFEATREIKAQKSIPIIALTASVSTDNPAYDELFDGILHKPVKLYDLFSEAGRFLKFSLYGMENASSQGKDQVQSVAFEQITDPQRLLEKLDAKILDELNNISGTIVIGEVKKLAKKLMKLASEHSFNLLLLYAEELYKGAASFDTKAIEAAAARIRNTLQHFQRFFRN
ncbi:MAG: hypothetical protein Kow0029_01550 [Candidatus Rifleibacteriota bacterium]